MNTNASIFRDNFKRTERIQDGQMRTVNKSESRALLCKQTSTLEASQRTRPSMGIQGHFLLPFPQASPLFKCPQRPLLFRISPAPHQPVTAEKGKWKCWVTQCPTLQPMGCSPPGSSVCGSFQARILEWVAIPFSRVSSRPELNHIDV